MFRYEMFYFLLAFVVGRDLFLPFGEGTQLEEKYKDCLYDSREKTGTWNFEETDSFNVQFYIGPDWLSTREVLKILIDNVAIILIPPSMNLNSFVKMEMQEFKRIVELNKSSLAYGWNNVTVKPKSSVLIVTNAEGLSVLKREENATISSLIDLQFSVSGFYSIVNCNTRNKVFQMEKRRTHVPFVFRKGDPKARVFFKWNFTDMEVLFATKDKIKFICMKGSNELTLSNTRDTNCRINGTFDNRPLYIERSEAEMNPQNANRTLVWYAIFQRYGASTDNEVYIIFDNNFLKAEPLEQSTHIEDTFRESKYHHIEDLSTVDADVCFVLGVFLIFSACLLCLGTIIYGRTARKKIKKNKSCSSNGPEKLRSHVAEDPIYETNNGIYEINNDLYETLEERNGCNLSSQSKNARSLNANSGSYERQDGRNGVYELTNSLYESFDQRTK